LPCRCGRRLDRHKEGWQFLRLLSTLAEIEAAADALSAEEKQELLLFLATRLRASGRIAAAAQIRP